MKKKFFKFSILYFVSSLTYLSYSQTEATITNDQNKITQNKQADYSIFLGLQPGFFVEPWFNSGEFDVNLLPLVLETAITDNLGLRIRSSLFYRAGNPNADLKLDVIGGSVGLFYYLNPRSKVIQYNGFFIGPFFGYSKWLIDNYSSITIAVESGYSFVVKQNVSLNLSGQIGVSHFFEKEDTDSHFGIFVNIGYWL